MRVLTTNNEWVDVRVGQTFCGIGFLKIVLTTDDVWDKNFEPWFSQTVIARVSAPWEKQL